MEYWNNLLTLLRKKIKKITLLVITRLIVKGGVISPGELREVVNMAMDQGLDSISFGSRQDIIFPKGFAALDKDN